MFKKINIKKIVLVLTAVTIISFVGAGISALIGGLTGKSSQRTVNIEKSFIASEVDSIDVATISYDIRLFETNSEEIKVHLHGLTNLPEKEAELKIEHKDDKLKIWMKRTEKITAMFVLAETVRLDIYLPADFNKEVTLKSISGHIMVGEIKFEKLKMKSTSGDMDTLNATSSSTALDSSSGNILLRGFTGELEAKTISGSIHVDYKLFDSPANLHSTSGDIEVKLPKESPFVTIFNTVSGDFNKNMPLTTWEDRASYGENGPEIKAKTVSGDYELYFK